MKYTLIADQVFDGEKFHQNLPVTIENGRIISLELSDDCQQIKLAGTLTPGFIDVQVNGGGGVLFNSNPSVAGLEVISQSHATFGTTGMLPTLITDDISVMAKAADAIAAAIEKGSDGILGVHFEGPHLSIPKKGVHPKQYIREISNAELAIFSRQDLGIKAITLAPENVAPEVIRQLVDAGVKVFIGHSNADYDTVINAIDAGATGFTHLYNAMSALDSRAPGVVGAAIDSENTWCGLIVDGHHVHAAAARIAIKAKPQGKIMLVTDAMPPVGMPDGSTFELFGLEVVRNGDRINAVTGELAGCVLDMATAVRNTVATLDQPLAEALRMGSLYPAEFLGLSHIMGRIAVGYRADLVLLDDNQVVKETYIAGKKR